MAIHQSEVTITLTADTQDEYDAVLAQLASADAKIYGGKVEDAGNLSVQIVIKAVEVTADGKMV